MSFEIYISHVFILRFFKEKGLIEKITPGGGIPHNCITDIYYGGFNIKNNNINNKTNRKETSKCLTEE